MHPEPETYSPEKTLMQACGLLFLFRAMARTEGEEQRIVWEEQIVRLIGDLVPCSGAAVVLGPMQDEVPEDCVALPLYVRGEAGGMLAVWFPPEEEGRLASHRNVLSAVATLAGAALENVRDIDRLRSENTELRDRLDGIDVGIVGDSAATRKLLEMVARVAPHDASVLVLGESGTGKELVARALHRLSPRQNKPFIAINCAALADTLLESELFGHEKGSFTGAVAQKKGKLEMAEGGTVFLDEIGEMAPLLQAKLLRVLQQREFERVGGTRTLKLDVRVVAATNRDLAAEVKRGAFREDLYHRLNVVALRTPALRERPGDILVLARYFLDRTVARQGRLLAGISPEAERMLTAYAWPGNVRELENAIERAVVLGRSDMLMAEDLPDAVRGAAEAGAAPAAEAGALQSSVTQRKRDLILTAWREAGGDHNLAAARLKIHPNSLRRLIRILNLRDSLPE